MKKFGQMALSSLFVASLLAGCNSQQAVSPVESADQVQAQSASSEVTLSMKKDDSKAVKTASNAIKSLNFQLKDKKVTADKKNVTDLVVKFKKNVKNDYMPSVFPQGYFQDERQLAQVANYTLNSMNSASTYENGYKIGMQTIQAMANDGVYVGRLSFAAANATKTYINGYKIVSAALQHMVQQRPNSAAEACNLALNMISACDTYEDGYRAGYSALQVINTTDNYAIKSVSGLALSQANSTSNYIDGYNVIVNAFRQIKVM